MPRGMVRPSAGTPQPLHQDGVRAAPTPHFRRVIILPNVKHGVRVFAFKEKN